MGRGVSSLTRRKEVGVRLSALTVGPPESTKPHGSETESGLKSTDQSPTFTLTITRVYSQVEKPFADMKLRLEQPREAVSVYVHTPTVTSTKATHESSGLTRSSHTFLFRRRRDCGESTPAPRTEGTSKK